MSQEQIKEEERKRREREGLVNPFSTGVNEAVLHLPEDLFDGAAGTYVVDRSGENPADRVELTNVVESEEFAPDYALVPIPQSPETLASIAAAMSSSSLQTSDLPLAQDSSNNLKPVKNISQPHGVFLSSLRCGKMFEAPNHVRDYLLGVTLTVSGLGLLAFGASHGNVALMAFGAIALIAGLIVMARANEAQNKASPQKTLEQEIWSACPTVMY